MAIHPTTPFLLAYRYMNMLLSVLNHLMKQNR